MGKRDIEMFYDAGSYDAIKSAVEELLNTYPAPWGPPSKKHIEENIQYKVTKNNLLKITISHNLGHAILFDLAKNFGIYMFKYGIVSFDDYKDRRENQ